MSTKELNLSSLIKAFINILNEDRNSEFKSSLFDFISHISWGNAKVNNHHNPFIMNKDLEYFFEETEVAKQYKPKCKTSYDELVAYLNHSVVPNEAAKYIFSTHLDLDNFDSAGVYSGWFLDLHKPSKKQVFLWFKDNLKTSFDILLPKIIEQPETVHMNLIGDFYWKGGYVDYDKALTSDKPELAELKSFAKSLIDYSQNIDVLIKTHTPVCLSYISHSIDNQLEVLNLKFLNNFKYQCPFNKYIHYSIIPTAYLCKKDTIAKKFLDKDDLTPDIHPLRPHNVDYLEDYKFVISFSYNNEPAKQLSKLNHIQEPTIGSGYTLGCYPSDGSVSRDDLIVELDNGDYIILKALFWCNK